MGVETNEKGSQAMRYSPLVERVAGRGAGAWSVHIEAMHRREAGHDVILLTVGDPDQRAPEPVIAATIAALRRGRTGYGAILGQPAARAAIATRVAQKSGQPCAAANVVIVPGTQAGLYCAVQCLAGPGDEIVVMDPVYATYPGIVGAAGATNIMVPLDRERGFHPDLDAIERALSPRTRVLWINSPHNPTGAVLTRDEVAAIAELCRRYDLWLLSDEVYEDLAFARPHTSAWSLPGMAERTVVVSSLSKSHAMPGFRFGWLVGPERLAQHQFNLLLSMLYGGPPFIQEGALVALETELPMVAEMRETYRRRAATLSNMLARAPHCRVIRPEGGMFALLDVRGTGLGAAEFALSLLRAEDVAVLPCDGFGAGAQGHLRIALTAPDPRLEDAARRIVRFAEMLSPRPSAPC